MIASTSISAFATENKSIQPKNTSKIENPFTDYKDIREFGAKVYPQERKVSIYGMWFKYSDLYNYGAYRVHDTLYITEFQYILQLGFQQHTLLFQ